MKHTFAASFGRGVLAGLGGTVVIPESVPDTTMLPFVQVVGQVGYSFGTIRKVLHENGVAIEKSRSNHLLLYFLYLCCIKGNINL